MPGKNQELPPTPAEIRDAVATSGFPLQFAVAKQLLERGYDVQPSTRFLNRAKSRESEIDVLALKRQTFKTSSGTDVDVAWRLAIEVKDSYFPFVLFGLDATPLSAPGMMHPDSFHNHIQTTRDRGIRNRFGAAAFNEGFNSGWSRQEHHQLSAVPRLYLATTFERTDRGNIKLHVPATLVSALASLGAYIDYVAENWLKLAKQPDLETIGGGNLQIYLNFFMLVHRGPHYRFGADSENLAAAELSSVFSSYSADDVNVSYIVDFVAFERLGEAIVTIEATATALLRGFVGTILASK